MTVAIHRPGLTLSTRLHAGRRTWGGSVRPGHLRRALPKSWRAPQHSCRPSVAEAEAGAADRTASLISAKREAALRQQEQQHSSWLQVCKQVAAFQQQHGRLPRASADAQGPLLPGERTLGLWRTAQLLRKAGSTGPPLSAEERKSLLGIPGWRWWAGRRVAKPWEQWRQEVEAFCQQHGRLPRQAAADSSPFLPGEQAMGFWKNRQRSKYKTQKLSAERIAALEAISGWCWAEYSRADWEQQRQQVEAFYQQHGRLPRRAAGQKSPLLPGEKELGDWIRNQRACYKGQAQPLLSAERVAALERTPGWSWGEYTLESWESRCQQVQFFVRQHGRFPREKGSKRMPLQPCENELGSWCYTQRMRRKGSPCRR